MRLDATGETTEAIDGGVEEPGAPLLEWFIAILFHPDTRRIGETVALPVDGLDLTLGRQTPLFAPVNSVGLSSFEQGRGLEDRQVSRNAATLIPSRTGWRLARASERSRLRLAGAVVTDPVELSAAELERGLVLMLGSRVLIHLRLQPRMEGGMQGAVPGLLGVSLAAQTMSAAIERAARSRSDVLILGPTGTGKGVAARAIHAQSQASAGPWVAVNMAALPAELAAASLFGTRRGAYTGAERAQRGYFREAEGGTLFLDEIGDLPAAIQPLLLRALQEREVQVVGGGIERVELRVIAATERDPDSPGSSLRESLRHRLGAMEIRMTPLRDRVEDVALIAAHGFAGSGALQDTLRITRQRWQLSADDVDTARWARCFEQLCLYTWPGNVRELLQIVAQIREASHSRLQVPQDIAGRLSSARPIAPLDPVATDHDEQDDSSNPSATSVSDEQFIAAWYAARFEVTAVARMLQMSRASVYRRVRSLEECRLAADVPLGEMLRMLDECRGDLADTAERLAVSERGLRTRLRASGVAAAEVAKTGDAVSAPGEGIH